MATAKPKRLTALFVRNIKLAAGMYCDGGGLYLRVRDSGSRSWIFRYRQCGMTMDAARVAGAIPSYLLLGKIRGETTALKPGVRCQIAS